MSKIFTALASSVLVLLLSMTSLENAQASGTPDGTTPANEGVCDGLKVDGVTKGLYGLCVAYCEAQDLDSFDKEPPSTKILDNYNKKKTDTDPPMPCVRAPCPCWSSAEFSSITSDGVISTCLRASNKVQIVDNSPETHFAEANQTSGRESCRYIDLNISPTTVINLSITPDQAASCYAQVDTACTAFGY